MSPKQSIPHPENIRWHASHLSERERAQRLGQKGVVIWLTGLSGSGKSTIARELERVLVRRGKYAYVLDGDNVRHGLNADLDFSPTSRKENIRRIGEVAKLFCQANVICVTAFISPYRADRAAVRALFRKGEFVEVFCDAPLEACEARDVKGLYRKARQGKIKDFTGVFAPYEAPRSPELRLFTGGKETPTQSARKVLVFLKKCGLLKAVR